MIYLANISKSLQQIIAVFSTYLGNIIYASKSCQRTVFYLKKEKEKKTYKPLFSDSISRKLVTYRVRIHGT